MINRIIGDNILSKEVALLQIKDIISHNRKKQQMTQEELGVQLNVSGKTISNWERGKTYPDILLVPRLCEILKISINEFFNVTDVVNIDGYIEYDIKQLTRYKSKMIISIMLLLSPIIIVFGYMFHLARLTYLITIILYFYSIVTVIVETINMNTYIKEKYYSFKFVNVLKNLNIIYYSLLFLILTFLSLLLNEFLLIALSVLTISMLLIILSYIFVRKLSFNYSIMRKSVQNIIGITLIIIGLTLAIFKVDLLTYEYPTLITLGTLVIQSSFLKIDYIKEG